MYYEILWRDRCNLYNLYNASRGRQASAAPVTFLALGLARFSSCPLPSLSLPFGLVYPPNHPDGIYAPLARLISIKQHLELFLAFAQIGEKEFGLFESLAIMRPAAKGNFRSDTLFLDPVPLLLIYPPLARRDARLDHE